MDYVRFHAQLHSEKLAVHDLVSNRSWTYAQFDGFIAGVTGYLAAKDVGQGDRVACLSKNCADIIALHLACARLGALFVPLNWRLSKAEIAALIEDCEPSVIFGDELAEELGVNAEDLATLEQECERLPKMPDVWGQGIFLP